MNTGNFDVFDEVVSPDVGPRGSKDISLATRFAFPDLQATPEHVIATEDGVALAYTVTGTHEDDFLGAEPQTGEGRPEGPTDKISDAPGGR